MSAPSSIGSGSLARLRRPSARRTGFAANAPVGLPAPPLSLLLTPGFLFSFSQLRKALFMVKPDLDTPDEAVTMDMIKRGMIIAGSPRRVLDQLAALRDEIGHFGTLLMAGHDWDQPKLWRRSMELLARDVMPSFSRHAR